MNRHRETPARPHSTTVGSDYRRHPIHSCRRSIILRSSVNTMAPAQRAAWDAYLDLTRGLLPALHDDQIDADALTPKLGTVALRILRYAPLWDEHGPMLVAALHSAVRLHRAGDRAELADLLWAMGNRLYLLSAGPRPHRHGGRDHGAP